MSSPTSKSSEPLVSITQATINEVTHTLNGRKQEMGDFAADYTSLASNLYVQDRQEMTEDGKIKQMLDKEQVTQLLLLQTAVIKSLVRKNEKLERQVRPLEKKVAEMEDKMDTMDYVVVGGKKH